MLIALPINDTLDNKRTPLTDRVLHRLMEIVRDTDRVIVSDNVSCLATRRVYIELKRKYPNFSVIYNDTNLGIAAAVNKAWKQAVPGEIVVKMDNDCLINSSDWAPLIDYVFSKEPKIGILGVKRHDLAERPDASEPHYRTRLRYIAHKPGERWVVVEEANHVMGTCYAFNPKMLPKFGYLMQPDTVYGFDDAIAAARAHALGFSVCFLPQIDVDHLDVEGNAKYTKWKSEQAAQGMAKFFQIKNAIADGSMSPYYGG